MRISDWSSDVCSSDLHPTAYRSKYSELKAWMDSYADHPQAKRIYALALTRRPANYRRPQPPITAGSAAWAGQRASYDSVTPRPRSNATRSQAPPALPPLPRKRMPPPYPVAHDTTHTK